MSTHAIIAVRTSDGYKGRYVHFDGYTEAMLPAIKRCIQNHKVAGNTFSDAVTYMLGNHWSAFNLSEHKAAEAHSHSQTWYTENDEIHAEYLYILDDNEVTPYIRLGFDGWVAVDPSNTIKIKASR
jgi:hypothetical protein